MIGASVLLGTGAGIAFFQVERLEQVFELIGKAPRGKTCPAIDGIIEEGEEIMKEAEDDTDRDAGMLAAAQAVEH